MPEDPQPEPVASWGLLPVRNPPKGAGEHTLRPASEKALSGKAGHGHPARRKLSCYKFLPQNDVCDTHGKGTGVGVSPPMPPPLSLAQRVSRAAPGTPRPLSDGP